MNDDEDSKTVFAEYGCTLCAAQYLEQSITNLLLTACGPGVYTLENPGGWGRREHNEAREKFERRTLGQLLNALAPHLSRVDLQLLDAQLELALRRRNWLVHRYFVERAIELCTASGRVKMMVELREIRSLFEASAQAVERPVAEWATANGIQAEDFAEWERRLRDGQVVFPDTKDRH